MQDHLQHGRIERRIRQRQAIHVGQPHRTVRQPGARQPGPRQRQHRLGGIDPKPLRYPRRQQFQHAAGPGAHIQQTPPFRRQFDQCGFHRSGRQIERAHLVPIGPGAAEPFRGGAGTFGQYPRCLAPVDFQGGVGFRQTGDQVADQRSVQPGRQGEPGVCALSHPFQQAGITKQLQMTRQTRLGLSKNFSQFCHAERAPRNQRQQAQAGGLGRGTEGGEKALHRDLMT